MTDSKGQHGQSNCMHNVPEEDLVLALICNVIQILLEIAIANSGYHQLSYKVFHGEHENLARLTEIKLQDVHTEDVCHINQLMYH